MIKEMIFIMIMMTRTVAIATLTCGSYQWLMLPLQRILFLIWSYAHTSMAMLDRSSCHLIFSLVQVLSIFPKCFEERQAIQYTILLIFLIYVYFPSPLGSIHKLHSPSAVPIVFWWCDLLVAHNLMDDLIAWDLLSNDPLSRKKGVSTSRVL